MTQYRIEFKYIQTNYTSHGDWYNSKKFIEEYIDHLNLKYKGEITHWIGIKD